jgi:tetratricopeptide (TPR) repeat protein
MECGAWSQFRMLIKVAFEVCEDKESIEYAHLIMSAASVECESGNAKNAYPFIDKAMEIRKRLLPPDHEELANLYHNYANIHLTYEVTPKTIDGAKRTLHKALEIDMTKPEIERNKILHLRHLVLALTYTLDGDYDQAWTHIDNAQRYAVETFGPKCHFWAR